MAVLALTSAKGSPGTTTTALALTLLWPRPVVLVEADVVGGSSLLAGYLRGAISPHARSLLGLASAHRQGRLAEQLWHHTVPLDQAGDRHLVPTIADPVQAPSLAPVWAPLGTALSSLERSGVDVIVDAGRLGTVHGPDALLQAADLVLLTTRTQLPSVAAARLRVDQLREQRPDAGGDRDGLGLLLVGEGRPYTGKEVAEAVGLPIGASIAWDPAAAEVISIGAPRPRRWEQSPLLRTTETAVTAVRELIARRQARLDATRPPLDGAATATRLTAAGAGPVSER